MTPEDRYRLKEEVDKLEEKIGEKIKKLSERILAAELLADLKAADEEDEELIGRLSQEMSTDELVVKLDSLSNHRHIQAESLEGPISGLEALVRLAKQHQMPLLELIALLRNKTPKTIEEIQALDAWNHLQGN